MRRFRVIVNGLAYEVEVEELGTGAQALPAARQEQEPPLHVSPPKPSPARAEGKHQPPANPPPAGGDRGVVPRKGGGTSVTAPLPGAVLAVKAAQGDTVRDGQVVIILEAMKMENEITAPRSGTVTAVHAQVGASVGEGDVLLEIG